MLPLCRIAFVFFAISMNLLAQGTGDICFYVPSKANPVNTDCAPVPASRFFEISQLMQSLLPPQQTALELAQKRLDDAKASLAIKLTLYTQASEAAQQAGAALQAATNELSAAQEAYDTIVKPPVTQPDPTPDPPKPDPTPDPVPPTPVPPTGGRSFPIFDFGKNTWEYPDGFPKECVDAPLEDSGTKSVCPNPTGNNYRTGDTFRDPYFGHTVRFIADDGSSNIYPNPSALSAHGKYVNLTHPDGTAAAHLVSTGAVVPGFMPTQNGSMWWDPEDDDTFYYADVRDYRDATYDPKMSIFRARVGNSRLDRTEMVSTGDDSSIIWTGATGSMSGDRWVAWVNWNGNGDSAPPSNAKFCAAPLDGSGRKACVDPRKLNIPIDRKGIDFLVITDVDEVAGHRFLYYLPRGDVLNVDDSTMSITYGFLPPEEPTPPGDLGNHDGICNEDYVSPSSPRGERCVGPYADHSDTTTYVDENGKRRVVIVTDGLEQEDFQFIDGSVGWTRLTLAFRPSDGRDNYLKNAIPIFRGGGGHTSCAKKVPVCSRGLDMHREYKNIDAVPPQTPGSFTGELLTMRFNATNVTFHRLTKPQLYERTDSAGNTSYYDSPRASISGDGKMLVFTTSLGLFTQPRRVAVVDTGF